MPIDSEAKQITGARQDDLFGQLERLIKQGGRMELSHDKGGSGMGLYYCATLGGKWPYCYGGTPERALRALVSEYLRMEREALQKRIDEIDGHNRIEPVASEPSVG